MDGTRAGNVVAGSDAWSREAQRVRRLAGTAGRVLDEEDLLLQDVRDLQRRAARLQRAGKRHGLALLAGLRRLVAECGAVARTIARTSTHDA
jgi:hypothetical protein